MTIRLNPYISFRDEARDAMEFYHSVFGGELTVLTFADFEMSTDPSESEKVMHSMLEADHGMTLMASDTPSSMEFTPGTSYSISLSGDDDALLRGYWVRLSEGGTVLEPLEQAPWGDLFGMCIDRFGTHWMVSISAPVPS